MKRITDAQLEALATQINELTDSPLSYRSDITGKIQIGHYHISYAYGGVCLHRIVSEGGGIRTVLMGGHVTKRELYDAMSAFIDGLEAGKQLPKD